MIILTHDTIKDCALYRCTGCESVAFGIDIDWFEDDDQELFICPVCDHKTKFIREVITNVV